MFMKAENIIHKVQAKESARPELLFVLQYIFERHVI